MATEFDKARVEFATAIVNERTAKIELLARWVQLSIALVKLATAATSAIAILVLIALRL